MGSLPISRTVYYHPCLKGTGQKCSVSLSVTSATWAGRGRLPLPPQQSQAREIKKTKYRNTSKCSIFIEKSKICWKTNPLPRSHLPWHPELLNPYQKCLPPVKFKKTPWSAMICLSLSFTITSFTLTLKALNFKPQANLYLYVNHQRI